MPADFTGPGSVSTTETEEDLTRWLPDYHETTNLDVDEEQEIQIWHEHECHGEHGEDEEPCGLCEWHAGVSEFIGVEDNVEAEARGEDDDEGTGLKDATNLQD